jgi:hypothetical protein
MSETLPTMCEACAYDLQGLAEAGRCPECGQPYDKARRVGVRRRHSPATTTQAVRKQQRLKTLGFFLAAVLTGLLGLVMGVIGDEPWPPIVVMGMIALLLTMAGLANLLELRRGG